MSRKLALIIGNSHYQDPRLAQLITPQEDVNDLADVLRAPDIGDFDEVKTLVNESDANIRLSIEDFFADKKPDDLLVIYFSGHGVRDEQGHLYLAVHNTRANRLRATALPAEFITSEMDRSRSKRQVLILDCCHSGAFAQGAKAVPGASAGTGPAFEGSGFGRVVLTATDATQYAWEGDKVIGQADRSVFTHFLVEGLRTGEADADHDSRITLDEIYDYVYERVVSATPKQTPGKWSYKQQGDIVLANNPAARTRPIPLPVELQQLIEHTLPTARLSAVDELARLLHSPQPGLVLSALAALQKLAEVDDSLRVRAAAAQALQANALPALSTTARPEARPATTSISTPASSTAAPPQAASLSPRDRLRRIPAWGWAAGGVLILFMFFFVSSMLSARGGGLPATPTPPPINTAPSAYLAPRTPTPTARSTATLSPTVASSPSITPTFTMVPGLDQFEPNADFDTAALIGLGLKYDRLNFVPTDVAATEGDKDYYKVRVKQGLRVTCRTMDLAPGTDTTLTLYDEQRQSLGTSDDIDAAAGDMSSRVVYTTTYDGFLYLLADQKFEVSNFEAPRYTYSLACAPAGADTRSAASFPDNGSIAASAPIDQFESNADFDQATTLGLNVKYTNLNFVRPPENRDKPGDDDYYKVRIKPGQMVTCRTLDLPPGTDTILTLYNDQRQELATTDDVDAKAGDFSSSASYLSTYEGFLYLLVAEDFPVPDSEVAQHTYSLECVLSQPPTLPS